jgi:kynureninase
METELLAWRDQFPILARSTYLISNSLGAMPRAVYDSLKGYADGWASEGVRAWETKGWWDLPMQVGDLIAPLLGAQPGTVSTHLNVSLASAIVASCFDFDGPRNKIVCSELNFPSIIYLYRQQERRGAKLELVPSQDGITVPLPDMLDAIDETTALVPISHVIFKSAYVQDVPAIVEKAHEVGALVALDTYQSTGVMPVEVEAWDVDFAVGGTLKWLCGGPGVSYLYAKPELAETLEPAITGWMSHVSPFSFDASGLERRADGWRFLNGTPGIPSLHAAVPGLEIINEVGVEAIRAKSLRQTDRLIAAASQHGWNVNTPRKHDWRGGTVTLDVPDAEAVTGQLLERDIFVDFRPGAGIRLSPHFYTTDEEIDHAVDIMASLVE